MAMVCSGGASAVSSVLRQFDDAHAARRRHLPRRRRDDGVQRNPQFAAGRNIAGCNDSPHVKVLLYSAADALSACTSC